jgi:phosphoesterase RecJ-like protein
MATLDAVLERLKRARRVAIFSHQRPDPDALGSQAAAACILAHLGATDIRLPQFGEIPGPYRFLLDGIPAKVVEWNPAAAQAAAECDTILLVDTCTYQQLEPAAEFLKANREKVVAIDHHLSRDDIGPLLYTDTTAAACVEVLWELARLARVPIDKLIALPLMSGLVGDTGWFRFDSVRPLTHQMAADLVQHLDPSALYERLMQNETKSKLGLMQRALASLRWSAGDRFACMLLRYADFTETGATQAQTEYLVDMPMMVGTAEVVALMSELPEGRIRVSLRSKHDIDVNKICRLFGGGGHAKAAGCRLDGPLNAAYEKLAAAVVQALGA